MEVDLDKLKEFLTEANKDTYASGKEPEKREDGARIYKCSKGDFEYEDIYYGSTYFSGMEVVRYNGVVVWTTQYYGGIIKDVFPDNETVYSKLRKFLLNVDDISPQGKDNQRDQDFVYNNVCSSDSTIEKFRGREMITYEKQGVIYELRYFGGIVKK